MWNEYIGPLPTDEDLEESDSRLDRLVDCLLQEDDPEQNRFAVESLAERLGLAGQIGNDDPLKQFKQFAAATESSFYFAGQRNPGLRGTLAVAAAQHARELLGMAREWGEPEEDIELEREWGPLIRVGRFKVT